MIDEIDIQQCDTEPIHLCGKIQSIGYLLAFNKKSLRLTFASQNSIELFSNIDFTKFIHFSEIFDTDFFQFVLKQSQKKFYNELYPLKVIINNKIYRSFVCNSNENIIVEFEEQVSSESDFSIFNQFNQTIENIRNIDSLYTLYATVVQDMKIRFGFDRVMMYKFDEIGNGEVIAEEKETGLESFIGLKYPATDIPKQARELYLTNLSRAIFDVKDEGININSYNHYNDVIDLSYSVFRSVSPVHIQYLKNMGVTATHAISLVIQNKLWGIIIFHNYSGAKFLNFSQRQIAQTLASSTSMAIEILESKIQRENINIEKKLIERIKFSEEKDPLKIIIDNWIEFSAFLGVCGFSMLEKNNVLNEFGFVPDVIEVKKLSENLDERADNQLMYHDEIFAQYSEWKNESITGYIQLSISKSTQLKLIFWRKSHDLVINWAGNPEKKMDIIEINNRKFLTPRSSFAQWQQTVKGKSISWSDKDISFAESLCDTLINKEIERINDLIKENHELKENHNRLNLILSDKTSELFRLNKKLKDELDENRKYQKELEIAKASTEQLNKLKSDFISNIGHEVRTPINGIIGLSQLILLDPSNQSEVTEISNLILESSNRLLNTVNRILKVSRIENNQSKVYFEEVDIIKLIELLIKPLYILSDNKHQRLVLNIHDKELKIISDSHYLGQIFTNLISNAIKYTPSNGLIEINIKTLNNSDSLLFFSIEDNGIGIDENIIDKIFDPFFIEAEVSKQPDNSTGLGLYLVKNYLSYLGGNIKVNSTKGKGSIFVVTIPIKKNVYESIMS